MSDKAIRDDVTFVLVGHCGADSYSLTHAIRSAVPGAAIVHAGDEKSCAQAMEGDAVLLVNRVLDGRFTTDSGVELIANLAKAKPKFKIVLISNYADAQQAAVAAGARPGFGKSQVGSASTAELLRSLAQD